MKKIVKSLLLLCLILILAPNKFVQASTNQQINFGTKITGTISEDNTSGTYKIVLPEAGKIDLELNSYIRDVYVGIVDSNGDYVQRMTEIYYGSEDSPVKWNFSENLEAGTYYIKLEKYSGYTGTYNLKVNYTTAKTNDMEPNNGTVTAQKFNLNSNPTKGYISWNDSSDVYKLDIPEAGKINVQLNSYIRDVYVGIVDSNGNYVQRMSEVYYGSEDNPVKWDFSENLEAGTYYIKLEKYSGYTGMYDLKVNYNAAKTKDIEPNNGTVTAQKINLNSSPIKGYISWNDSSDVYKFDMPKSGKVNIQLNSYIRDVYVGIVDSNGNYVKNTREVYYGSEDQPVNWSFSDNLQPGTYYIKIEKCSGYTGIYDLKVNTNSGWVQNGDKSWSYFDTNTSELKTGWFQDGGTWYYSNSNGIMQAGWLQSGNAWYYLGSNGAMRTGWSHDGSTWYFLNSNGTMRTGWFQDGQSWYFMNSNGTMKTGWLHQGNNWYFMYSNGVMACNTTIDGCKLGNNGQWN